MRHSLCHKGCSIDWDTNLISCNLGLVQQNLQLMVGHRRDHYDRLLIENMTSLPAFLSLQDLRILSSRQAHYHLKND